jgi:hypothetical protein
VHTKRCLVFPNHPISQVYQGHSNYVTIKDSYQIVNKKSGKVVMSIGKMYALKQSILNILYKDITEEEKAFMAKVSL